MVGAFGERTGRALARPTLFALAITLVLLMLFAGAVPTAASVASPSAASPARSPAASSPAAPASTTTAPSVSSPATPTPSANNTGGFNPYCHPIDVGVCVSMANANETNIVPAAGQTVCGSRPNSTATLDLYVKSRLPLNWSGNPPPARFGVTSPIALNVTGVLWNGNPYYTPDDNSVWHASSNIWWTGPFRSANVSYPWWYGVEFTARASNGGPNFYPGMTIDWWVYLTFYSNGTYTHHEGPHFECTYSGAWPYSPYPGSKQYAGASAVDQDINLTVSPQTPNWNDSVSFVLNTTQADAGVGINATIGQAWVNYNETTANGTPIVNGTLAFPVTVTGATGVGNGIGDVTTTAVLPARFALISGAIVYYQISVFDTAYNQLVTPWANYTVGGNGSFASGVFTDDLDLTTTPSSVLTAPGTAELQPGQPLNVTVVSRDPSAAIFGAEIGYTLRYTELNEYSSGFIPLYRERSTIFSGQIPGLPLATDVNFSLYAWDFGQQLEISPTLGYATPTFGAVVPIVPTNSTFFYVYVYDNGSHEWVSGATVQVLGPHGFFNSMGTTTLGVAYPNATSLPFSPLLVPANASYTILVNDPYFIPPGLKSAPSDYPNATVLALHSMTNRGALVQASNYLVVQEGDQIIFYLNSTPPSPPISPSAYDPIPLAMILGVVGAVVVALPVMGWYGKIRKRRKEEEKRVTL